MQSVKNGETIELTQTDRQIISHVLENPKVYSMEKLFEQFEKAHETFGTIELQKDVDVDRKTIVSILVILNRMSKEDKDIWKVIQSENKDLRNFIYGTLTIWLSEHNKNLRLGY